MKTHEANIILNPIDTYNNQNRLLQLHTDYKPQKNKLTKSHTKTEH